MDGGLIKPIIPTFRAISADKQTHRQTSQSYLFVGKKILTKAFEHISQYGDSAENAIENSSEILLYNGIES